MATAEHHDLFQARGADELANNAPLAARMRPRTLDEFVGQDHIVGPGRLLRRGHPGRPALVADLLRAARHRQDYPRAGDRRHHPRPLHRAERGAGRRETTPRGDRRGARVARPARRAHHPVYRRGAPLEQGAAGRAAAERRERHHRADRRHHREPLLRGDQAAGEPQPHLSASGPRARRPEAGSADGPGRYRARTGGLPDRRERGGDGAPAERGQRRRAQPAQCPGTCGRHHAGGRRWRGARRPAGGGGIDPTPGGAVRQGGRRPLRHHQRVHQERARLRSRRGAVLDGAHGVRGARIRATCSAAC